MGWVLGRRSALRHLRDLGMGKTILEETMQSEAQFLVEDLRRATGKAQPLPLSVGLAVHNIVCKVLAGELYTVVSWAGVGFTRVNFKFSFSIGINY